MQKQRSWRFTHTLSRRPANSVKDGLRAAGQADPVPELFKEEHHHYLKALERSGVLTTVLPSLEPFPDSVFVEDPVLCLSSTAVILRPGASSRFGEAEAIRPELEKIFDQVVGLTGPGFVDGGDILLTDDIAFIGLSERTDRAGVEELRPILERHGYQIRVVTTPAGVLHFKSDCGLLDSETVFATKALADSGCFNGFKLIEAPSGEEAAANLIRVNDFVIMRTGFALTRDLLEQNGYAVITVPADEAAKVDGGLSCMSLRFSLK